MNLTHRRILYLFFFLIFFITAPIVILWAEGFRYNFTKHQLQKSGVLFLESKPSKAEIYLNGKLQNDKTTARLKNLLPDDYQVEIKKDGYQTWQKKLAVYSGQTTFAQYVRLFKQNSEIKNILSKSIILASQKIEDSLAIIYQAENEVLKLGLFNLANQNLKELNTLNYQPEKITLSPGKSFVYLEYNPEYAKQQWIFDINKQQLIDLLQITAQEIKHLKWLPDTQDEIIYGISLVGLEKINLNSQEKTTLLKKPMLDFYLHGDEIFWLEETLDKILLNRTNLNNLDEFETITSLPISDNYEFYNTRPNLLTLLDKKNEILYLIKTDNQAGGDKIKIFPETNYIQWLDGLLLMGNNFEISTYDWEKDERKLIVRLSSAIKKAIWYPVATHLIYLVTDSLKVIELVNHQRNLHTLIEKTDMQNVFINDKGDKIYFIDGNGISEVEIQ